MDAALSMGLTVPAVSTAPRSGTTPDANSSVRGDAPSVVATRLASTSTSAPATSDSVVRPLIDGIPFSPLFSQISLWLSFSCVGSPVLRQDPAAPTHTRMSRRRWIRMHKLRAPRHILTALWASPMRHLLVISLVFIFFSPAKISDSYPPYLFACLIVFHLGRPCRDQQVVRPWTR